MTNPPVAAAITEIDHVKRDCLKVFDDLRAFYPGGSGMVYPDIYRLLVTPMLYAVWERCFTLCHSIALRLLRTQFIKPQSLGPQEKAVWLMRASFYQSLIQKLFNQNVIQEGTKPKRGHFPALCDFLDDFDQWNTAALDPATDTADLVMTFSNVNPEVVALNAKAIGISDFPHFQKIKFGQLNDLVGRRNGIGHGAILAPPTNGEFTNLWSYTEQLVTDYCDVFMAWMAVRFTSKRDPVLHRLLNAGINFLQSIKQALKH